MTEPKKQLDDDILIELLLTNLEHARHVENERLSFNSIYIAVVAGFFALAFDFGNPLLTMFFIGILLIISLIGFLFTKRWSDVFAGHTEKAKQIALLLYGEEEARCGEDGEIEPLLNKYYYFEHSYQSCERKSKLAKARRKEKARATKEGRLPQQITMAQIAPQINFHSPIHRLCAIRTKTLFYLFYGIVVSVLAIFFVYSIIQLILGV